MSQWLDTLTTWLGAQPEWLGLAIFLIACIECLTIVGIVVPGTVVLFAVAALAGSGVLTLWQTLLIGYAGGLLGDALSYALGRRFHQDIRRLPLLRRHPEWLAQAEFYFQRYGVASLLLGRFIGPLRPMLPTVAGMLDMPLPRFITVSLLAAAGWAVVYLLPGWMAGAALGLALPEGFWWQAGLLGGSLAALLALIAQASLRERRAAAPLAAALSTLLLLALLLGWRHFALFDQILLELLQGLRTAERDVWMMQLSRQGDAAVQLGAGLLLGLLLLAARQWRTLLFATLSLGGSALANQGLKLLLARARPDILLQPLDSFSLPSAHSSAAFAFCLTLGVLVGRGAAARIRLAWLLLACLPAAAIAISRVYLGAHWPTDVLAGALLAGCVGALALLLAQRRTPLPALPRRLWWALAPSLLFGAVLAGLTSDGNAQQRYQTAQATMATTSGSRIAVAPPIRLIARAEKAPVSSPSCSAWAVPTAWAVMPSAMPRAAGLCTPMPVSNPGPKIAPITPTISTNTAASAAMPPSCSAISMAIGEVTDLGSTVICITWSAPNSQAKPMPSAVARLPASARVSRIGQSSWRMRLRLRNSGMARATVAGPRNTESMLTLARYSA
ncbi:undecaprenyl-diphosphatase [Geopseudomonas sagittaria]|uniref:Undecaprenyl-diphosphatase n=1 Tax=Geopseudomonas sagittaria TaxID=1135990 RepID=A0A1I5P7F0_9GAMM|nr:undecaprenyl-diphosphatase [Pseudomonas sagittaria]